MSIDFAPSGTEAIPPLEPRYDLSDESAAFMGRMLMQERGAVQGAVNCYFVGPGSIYGDLGRKVEQQVFLEKFGNTPDEMQSEYGPYEDASSFFITLSPEGEPIGVLRVIGGESLNDFKSLRDVSQERPRHEHPERPRISLESFAYYEGVDPSTVWDIGTIAIPKEHRGATAGNLSAVLHRALLAKAKAEGIEHFVAVIDKGEHGNLNKLGVPFKPILGSLPFEYLGSKTSTALHCRVADVDGAMLSKAHEYMSKAWDATGMGEMRPSPKADLYQLYAKLIGNIVFGSEVDDKLRFDFSK